MEIPVTQLPPSDPRLVEAIVGQLKSRGIFDKFRKECLADVDTKPAFQNLRLRVDGQVKKFLETKTWKSDISKNQLRDRVRKNIQESGILDAGIDAIINQVVNPKITPLILPYVEDTVYAFLQIDRPTREAYNDLPKEPYMPARDSCQEYLSSPVTKDYHDAPHVLFQSQSKATAELPMETDAISSEEDETLLRTTIDRGSLSIAHSPSFTNSMDKMEEENTVNSFSTAREDAEKVVSAVEKLTIKEVGSTTDSLSQSMESSNLECRADVLLIDQDQKSALPFFDHQSLDSISSNSSGLSFSPPPTSTRNSPKATKGEMAKLVEAANNSAEELRSTQSTPLEDEKSPASLQSKSPKSSREWAPNTLPKDLPSTERITIASFDSYSSNTTKQPPMVVSGASPVSAESQGSMELSLDKDSLFASQTDDSQEAKDKLEGDTSSNNSSVVTPDLSKERERHLTKDKKDGKSHKHERSHSRDKHRDKERSSRDDKYHKHSHHKDRRHSKSRHDDHHSHRNKDRKYHRKDKEDDSDREKSSKGHSYSSSTTANSSSNKATSSTENSSKDSKHKSHSSSHRSNRHEHNNRSHKSGSNRHEGKKVEEKMDRKENKTPKIRSDGKDLKSKTDSKKVANLKERKESIDSNGNSRRESTSINGNAKKESKTPKKNIIVDKSLKPQDSKENIPRLALHEKSNGEFLRNMKNSKETTGIGTKPQDVTENAKLKDKITDTKSPKVLFENMEKTSGKTEKKLIAVNEDITLMGNLNRKNKPTNIHSPSSDSSDQKLTNEPNNNYKSPTKLKNNGIYDTINKRKNTTLEIVKFKSAAIITSDSESSADEEPLSKQFTKKVYPLSRRRIRLVNGENKQIEKEPLAKKPRINGSECILPIKPRLNTATKNKRLILFSFSPPAVDKLFASSSEDESDFEGFIEGQPKKRQRLESEEGSDSLYDDLTFEGFDHIAGKIENQTADKKLKNYLSNFTIKLSFENVSGDDEQVPLLVS